MRSRLPRRRFLQSGAATLATGIAGCSLSHSTSAVDVRIANVTDSLRTVTTRLLDGDELAWKQRVELPARKPNDAYAVETTDALQSVEDGTEFTVEAEVEARDDVWYGSLTTGCTGDRDNDGVWVTVLPNAGLPYASIKASDC